jgi:type I restriction enzyme S subunit
MTSQHEIVTLESVSEKIEYGLTTSATSSDTGIKFLRITDIQENGVDWQSVPFCECSEKDFKQYSLARGDIVFARTGATTGKSFLIKDTPEKTVFASYLIRVRANQNIVDPEYLSCFFQTQQYWQQISDSAVGAAQVGVNGSKLAELKLPLPPLTEQKRIASLLRRADRLRQLRRTAHELGDALLQSVFLEMFGDPETNPKKWKVGHVRDLCENILDCPHETPIHSEKETEYASIRSSDIQNGHLDWSTTKYVRYEVYKRRIARGTPMPGDIVYCREGARFGNAARIPENLNKKICLGQRMMSFRVNSQKATSEFLWAILESNSIHKQAVNMVGGSAAPHVNVQDIKKFNIIIPPLSLQEEFAGVVARVESLRGRMAEAGRQVNGLFEAVLSESFA